MTHDPSLSHALKSAGISIAPDFGGEILRDGPQWFIGKELKIQGKTLQIAHFGDWSTDVKLSWQGETGEFTPEDFVLISQAAAESAEVARQAKILEHERVAEQSATKWGNLTNLAMDAHPYWKAKGLEPGFGVRGDAMLLYIPLHDEAGKIWGLQKIFANGQKRFEKGGRKRGLFYTIGEIKEAREILLCEGFATGASLRQAYPDLPVVCGFDAGNLLPVANTLATTYPTSRIIVCADNDQWKGKNVGLTLGTEASQSVSGILAVPDFGGLILNGAHPSDFNDLARLSSVGEVRRQIDQAISGTDSGVNGEPSEEDSGTTGEESQARGSGADGDAGNVPGAAAKVKKVKLTKGALEKKITEALLGHFGENLLRQDKNLFLYDLKRWREIPMVGIDQIKNRINSYCGNTLQAKDVDSVFRTFMRYVPAVPEGVNLFNPNPVAVNFENGTLHLVQTLDHTYRLEFGDHKRGDWVTNLLPYRYDVTRQAKNTAFLEMLDRVFEGDADRDQKIRAVRQMYGACLASAWPHFFMLHGKPKTGKSTVIMLAEHLVARENRCSVEPHEFHSFNMESMVGKLLNADPDIDTQKPITESQIKKVIDRREFRIKRKGIADAYGYIPGTHIFGGNDIPPTLSGYQKAHDRRWTFIEFNHEQGVGSYDKEFWAWVWDQSPEGLVNFAVEGLEDLCRERGHYLNPESGIAKMKEWQGASDPVGMFLDDVNHGEVLDFDDGKVASQNRLIVDPKGQVTRAKLWSIYVNWVYTVKGKSVTLERNSVFQRFRERGFHESRTKKGRYFLGLRVVPKEDAPF